MNEPRRKPLQLSAHVCACERDGQVILLDLLRDKYLALGRPAAQAMARVVDGWPIGSCVRTAAASEGDVDTLVKRLVADELLTNKSTLNQRPGVADLPEAVATLGENTDLPVASAASRHVWRFVRSAMHAASSLRWRPLYAVVKAVAARRSAFTTQAATFPFEDARDAVAIYETLRPLMFTSRDACLFDSLALVNFLAHQRMFPRWVIGVRTRPFGAHSWVQNDGVVLNDLHEHVRSFTPILVV